jgi:hypothetical protein
MSLDELVSICIIAVEQLAGPDVILLDYVGEGNVDPVVVYFYVVDVLTQGSQVTDCAIVAKVGNVYSSTE